ncbi:hemolysin family protein [Methylopila turkensis]|uniref:DNA-binding protein n=1 Tax=Methylopila turkensis TaxID=1437816 RepID=A0A9W6N8K4_9HYPH|nr:hemolysin family protein [Methylopila turkensis]GLK81610.1 DNA-binding protein [Methylopila turkensis]
MNAPASSPRDRAHHGHDAEARQDNWIERLRSFVGLGAAPTLREEFAEALETGDEADLSISALERVLLRNVLALKDTRVDDVMVPRTDIDAVSEDMSFAELLATFQEAGHSRLPVHRGSLDEPAGMVHVKDALALIARAAADGGLDAGGVAFKARIADLDLVRPVIYAPPSMAVSDLLTRMQSLHIHLALVVDEYGGVDGLVSIEDLVETIVGDIEDEHDDAEEARIAPDGAGGFVADARASLEDVVEAVGTDFDVSAYSDDVDTIGGLIVTLAGRVPAQGDVVQGPGGRRLEVLEADPRRVVSVRIAPPAPKREDAESDTPGGAADAA